VGDTGEKTGDREDRGENGVRACENRVRILSQITHFPTFSRVRPINISPRAYV
jgi:hypothetical protein